MYSLQVQLSKIISGGQTGVDRAALEFAKANLINTGGLAPKGFRTTAGNDPSLTEFNMTESHSYSYSVRTQINVQNSDATLIIASNLKSAGTVQTRHCCHYEHKSCFVIGIENDSGRYNWTLKQPDGPVMFDGDLNSKTIYEFRQWIVLNNISVLNIAGNSEASSPGINTKATAILQALFGDE